MQKENYTISQYLERWGSSRSTVYREMRLGLLRSIKRGGRRLIPHRYAEERQAALLAASTSPKAAPRA